MITIVYARYFYGFVFHFKGDKEYDTTYSYSRRNSFDLYFSQSVLPLNLFSEYIIFLIIEDILVLLFPNIAFMIKYFYKNKNIKSTKNYISVFRLFNFSITQ